jgi:hypothetical protein
VVGIIKPLLLIISYLTPKYWLQPLLSCSSRFLWRRPKRVVITTTTVETKRLYFVLDEGNVSNETDQATTTSSAADDPVPSPTTPLVHRHHTVMGDPSTRDGERTASVVHPTGISTHNPDGSSYEGLHVKRETQPGCTPGWRRPVELAVIGEGWV